MDKKATHTPTPHWDKHTFQRGTHAGEVEFTIWDADGFRIGTAINEIQAEKIVAGLRAVNSHEELLAAAKAMVAELKIQRHGFQVFQDKLETAIAKADGK